MNTKLKSTLAFAGFVLAGLAGAAQAQNLVTNGDFNSAGALFFSDGVAELYATPSEEPYDFDTGWFTQTARVVFNQSGSRGITTTDGGNFVTLEYEFYTNYSWTQRRNGVLFSNVSLQAGTTYTLSFDAQLVESTVSTDTIYMALILWGWQDESQTALDQPLGGSSNSRVYFDEIGTWAHHEYTFTAATDADYRLGFGLSGLGNPVYIENTGVIALDNVSITAAAVPEPATYAALFGAGALGFTLWRRRPRRSSTREGAVSAASSVR